MPPARKLTTFLTAARKRRIAELHAPLNDLYRHYNQRCYVDPDPLVPLYGYADPCDQEIIGLITASLAFGNVKQILKSIELVLGALPELARTLPDLTNKELNVRLAGFRHRYVTGIEMASLLTGAGTLLREHGSLGAAFASMDAPEAPTILPGLTRFVHALRDSGTLQKNYLLPDPALGSACKRWFMYLRWMVRSDAVDLGLWPELGAHRLIIPVDTHMHRVALGLGLTRRNSADLKTAMEITQAFKVVCPEDPVRYDFCLTRLGIRVDGDMAGFLREAMKK